MLIGFGHSQLVDTFWAGIRSKKLIRCLSCIQKGQKCIQILWGHQNKKFLSLKTTENARYVQSVGKIPYSV